MKEENWKIEYQKLKRKYDNVKTERDLFYTTGWMLVVFIVGFVLSQFYSKLSELTTTGKITLASFTLAAVIFIFKIGNLFIKKVEGD